MPKPRKPTTPEETLAHLKKDIAPALHILGIGLSRAATIFDRFPQEAAALAVVASANFVEKTAWDNHLLALFTEAIEIIKKEIPPERMPHLKREAAVISDPYKLLKGPLPPLSNYAPSETEVSRKDSLRIIATIAVDFQRLCKVPLAEALRKLVGRDPREAQRLVDFRDALRRSKGGNKRRLYDQLTAEWRRTADLQDIITLYNDLAGKKRKP